MDVYFNVRDGSIKYPTCDYYDISMEYDHKKLPLDDPLIQHYNNRERTYIHVVHSDVHHFDDVGFLHCKNCNWCPNAR